MQTPFRKSAIDKISSPEQLDELMQITNPKSWIMLISLFLIIVTGIVWGFVGVVKDTVEGRGLLVQTGGIYDIYSNTSGQVKSILFNENDYVVEGDVIALITQDELEKSLNDNNERITELYRQYEQLKSFGAKDLKIQKKLLSDRQSLLDDSFQRVNEKIIWLTEQVEVGKGLFEKGLITKSNYLQSKQSLSMSKEELSHLENQSKEIEKLGLELQFYQKQELESSLQKINELERIQETLKQKIERDSKISSSFEGKILDISIDVGSLVHPGLQILKLEMKSNQKSLKGIIFVSGNDGKKVKKNMEVQIIPGPVKPEEYGVMFGSVKSISDFPSTTQGMMQSLKNDQMVRQLSVLGAPFEVVIEPIIDHNTISNFKWSSSDGPPYGIESNTPCVVKIIIDKRRPISLVLPLFRKIFGLSPIVKPFLSYETP